MDNQNTQNTQNTENKTGSNVFAFLYRTRVNVTKGSVPILNLSIIFSVLAVCSAPWLAVIGLVVALILGYRFSIKRNDPNFSGDFQEVVKDAAANVKSTVDSVIGESNKDTDDEE